MGTRKYMAIEELELKRILTYPYFDELNFEKRVIELENIGIDTIFSFGKTRLGSTSILGKGSVGLVVLVQKSEKAYALKIRRVDSNRHDMYHEAMLQSFANTIGVGPAIIDYSKNFILMEFINGYDIFELPSTRKIGKKNITKLISSLLKQCYDLDRINLDHGQLTKLNKHVIITKNVPKIIDFESSSVSRSTSNVTSISQSLFINGPIYQKIKDIIIEEKKRIIQLLRNYKKEKTRTNLDKIIQIIE